MNILLSNKMGIDTTPEIKAKLTIHHIEYSPPHTTPPNPNPNHIGNHILYEKALFCCFFLCIIKYCNVLLTYSHIIINF